jgi:hypothetical protein
MRAFTASPLSSRISFVRFTGKPDAVQMTFMAGILA